MVKVSLQMYFALLFWNYTLIIVEIIMASYSFLIVWAVKIHNLHKTKRKKNFKCQMAEEFLPSFFTDVMF